MSDTKQLHFNFDIMLAPDFTDLETLETRITNKTQYLQEISKTKKELNQLGALLNSSTEDLVYDETGKLLGVAVDINDFQNTNSTISDVMDNDEYEGGDDTTDKLLPPSNTAAFNKAIMDLSDEADLLAILSDIIGNDVFIQDLMNNPKDFVNNCEKVIEFLTKTVSALTSTGEGEFLSSALKEGCEKVLKAVVGVALDKFDLDKIMNQIIGDKIDLIDQAITKYTAMDQTGLAGSLKSKYNISFRSLTSNIFKKTYSNIKDISNKGFYDSLLVKSTREAANEGIDKIFSEGFLTNVGNTLSEQCKIMFNKSKVGMSLQAAKLALTVWTQEAMCYKLYLIAAMANYVLKNNLLDAAAAKALLMKVGKDFVTSVLQSIGKAAETAIEKNWGNSTTSTNRFHDVLDQRANMSDILGGTNEYYKDVYNFLNKVTTGSTYSSLTRYVDLFQRYALNNHNTGLKTLNVYEDEGVLQMFEYLKNEVTSNDSDIKSVEKQLEKITDDVYNTQKEQVISGLDGEIIDLNECVNSTIKSKTNNDAVDLTDYINNHSYKPTYTNATPDVDTNCWVCISNQKNEQYEDWNYSSDYIAGECVNYNNKFYKCKKATNGKTVTAVVNGFNEDVRGVLDSLSGVGGVTLTSSVVNGGGGQKTVEYTNGNGEVVSVNVSIPTYQYTKYVATKNTATKLKLDNVESIGNNVKAVVNAAKTDTDVYKAVMDDYRETVKINIDRAFYQNEDMISYKVDDPQQLTECVTLHIKYRQQKLEKLASMNRLYFAVKSE